MNTATHRGERPKCAPTADPFGCWLIVPGKPHAGYFLAGAIRSLCGCGSRPKVEQRATANTERSNQDASKHPAPFCPQCLAINQSRWDDRDGRITGVKS